MNFYPFIEAERAAGHGVVRACEPMGVSRSAYYQQRHGQPTARETSDAELAELIIAIHTDSKAATAAHASTPPCSAAGTESAVSGSPG